MEDNNMNEDLTIEEQEILERLSRKKNALISARVINEHNKIKAERDEYNRQYNEATQINQKLHDDYPPLPLIFSKQVQFDRNKISYDGTELINGGYYLVLQQNYGYLNGAFWTLGKASYRNDHKTWNIDSRDPRYYSLQIHHVDLPEIPYLLHPVPIKPNHLRKCDENGDFIDDDTGLFYEGYDED